MDTSDSECFESADEEISSEDEQELKTIQTSINKLELNTSEIFVSKENLESKHCLNVSKDENRNEKLDNHGEKCTEIIDSNITNETSKNVDTNAIINSGTKNVETIINTNSDNTISTSAIKSTDSDKLAGAEVDVSWKETKWTIEADTEIEHKQSEPINENTTLILSKSDKHSLNVNISQNEDNITNIEDKNEPNLWDDDEIDWEGESQKDNEYLKTHNDEFQKNIQSETENNCSQNAFKIEDNKDDKWEDNEWEPVNYDEKEAINHTSQTNDSGWGGWGSWGVSSILNTATQSVSTLTSHVSHGINTVLESGIGVPDPEEMARINKIDEEKQKTENQQTSETSNFGLGNLGNFVSGVSHLTKFVETTSNKVISGGLDTLETIGKKTMEVLQDGDPGLKKKRAFLKLDSGKPVLSQVLREAKEKAEEENKQLDQKHVPKRQKNYETLFDDHQGLVHLEALEMLSKLCTMKLQNINESLTSDALVEMQETMEQVKELCELPEDEEDEQLQIDEIREKLATAVNEINIQISYDKLLSVWETTDKWLSDGDVIMLNENELHQQAIENLAQLTALAVEQFHKAGELLLVKDHRSTADEADSLVQLTSTIKAFILMVANKFTEKLNELSEDTSKKKLINDLITNVFFEAANSSSYIQDAFQLLIPVLQVGAV